MSWNILPPKALFAWSASSWASSSFVQALCFSAAGHSVGREKKPENTVFSGPNRLLVMAYILR